MLTEKFMEVLKKEGVVSIVSWGESVPHIDLHLKLTTNYRLKLTTRKIHSGNETFEKQELLRLKLTTS